MPSFLPKSIRVLIDEFSRLPGIGPKSAQRLAMYLLHSPEGRVRELADAVGGLKKGLRFCPVCWNIAEDNLCRICADAEHDARNGRQICVVEEILDVVAIEKTGEYRGVYHVLHGALSPIDGIGPEQLKVQALMDRVREIAGVKTDIWPEVIIATNPGLEGETTALYLLKLIRPFENVRITRIARGLPVGGDLDYADEMTLTKALEGRAEYV